MVKKLCLILLLLVLVSSVSATIYDFYSFSDFNYGDVDSQNSWNGDSDVGYIIEEDNNKIVMWANRSDSTDYVQVSVSDVNDDEVWIVWKERQPNPANSGYNANRIFIYLNGTLIIHAGEKQDLTTVAWNNGSSYTLVSNWKSSSWHNNSILINKTNGTYTVYKDGVAKSTKGFNPALGNTYTFRLGILNAVTDGEWELDDLCIGTSYEECLIGNVLLNSPVDDTSYDTETAVNFQFNMTSDWNSSINATCDLNINDVFNQSIVVENASDNSHSFNSVTLRDSTDYVWYVNCSQDSYEDFSDEWTVIVNPYELDLNSPANATDYSKIASINFSFNASSDFWNVSQNITCNLSIDDVVNQTKIFENTWSNSLTFDEVSFTPEESTTYNWSVDCEQGTDVISGDETWYFDINTYDVLQHSPANATTYTEDTEVQFRFNATGGWDTGSNITCSLVLDGVVNQTEEFSGSTGSDVSSLLNDSLVGYYSLEDLTDALGNYNATFGQGTPTFDAGKVNNAVTTTNDNFLTVADNVDYDGGSAFTWAFWMKPTTNDGSARGILSKRVAAGNQQAYTFFLFTGGTLYYNIMGVGNINTGWNPGTNTWHHVVITYNGSEANEVNMYINGNATPEYTGQGAATIDNEASPLWIGTMNAAYAQDFIGQIDEIGIWKGRVLTTDEIAELYNGGDGLSYGGSGVSWVNPLNFSTNITFTKPYGLNEEHNWTVNCSQGVNSGETSNPYFFTMKGALANLRAETINDNNITFNWSYSDTLNATLGGQTVSTTDNNWTVSSLYSDYSYSFNFTDDDGNNNAFNIETDGWHNDLDNWSKKILITTDTNTIEEEGAGINIQLNSDNFRYTDDDGLTTPAFKYLNADYSDLRFIDYYDIEYLRFNVTSYSCTSGGSVEYNPANETSNTSAMTDYANCWDGDWDTLCYFPYTPSKYIGNISYNYTKPAGARDYAILRFKQGSGSSVAEHYVEVPTVCIGDKVIVETRTPGSTGTVYTYCLNQSDNSTWIELGGDCGYYFFESSIFWESECYLNATVIPLGFNDSTQTNVEKLDNDYDQKVWMYFNYSDSVSNESEALEVTIWNDTIISSVVEFVDNYPEIGSIVTSSEDPWTSMEINWSSNRLSNNRLRTAYNDELIGYTESWDNNTMTPSFTVTSLMANITLYYELYSEDVGTGLATITTGYNTTGDLISTPLVEWFSYKEYRGEGSAELCANVTDLNSHSSVNVSFIWQDQDLVNGSNAVSEETEGVYCANVSLTYGNNYTFMAEVTYSDSEINHSDSYSNDYLPVQEFFAGSTVRDDEDRLFNQFCFPIDDGSINRSLCTNYTGFRSGANLLDTEIYIETNITTEGLNVSWYDGSSWTDYEMFNNSDFSYLELTGLGSAWQTFYIYNSSGLVLNWTKPSLTHPTPAGGGTGLTRTDEQKYVSFNNSESSLSYQIMYLDKVQVFNVSSTSMWGYNTESDTNGYLTDNGQLFRGGVSNAGMEDTGVMSEVNNADSYSMMTDAGYGYEGGPRRRCYNFIIFYWNSSIVPSNNITSYYYRGWEANQTSGGIGPIPLTADDCITRRDCLVRVNVSSGTWDCQDDTIVYTNLGNISNMNIHQVEPVNTFRNDRYTSFLSYRYKTGFEFSTEGTDLYDFAYQHYSRYPSVHFSHFQQAFVIFNLPNNETLNITDSDSDGLSDYDELFVEVTNPFDVDTDGDGESDSDEVTGGTDPNIYSEHSNCYYGGGYNSTTTLWNATCNCSGIDYEINLQGDNMTINGPGSFNITTGGSVFNYSVGEINNGCVLQCESGGCIE